MLTKKNKGTVWFIAVPFVLLAVSWLWMLRLRITNITGSFMLGYFLALVGYLVIVVISTALFWSAIQYFAREYNKHQKLSVTFPVKIFILWAALEFVVSWLVAFIWYGKGGSFDTVLPFGSFSPWLAYTPFGLLSRLVGFYGLSAMFVAWFSCIAFVKLRRFAVPVSAIVLLFIGVSWTAYRTPTGPILEAQLLANSSKEQLPQIKPGREFTLLPEYGLDFLDTSALESTLGNTENRESFYLGSRHEWPSTGTQNVLIFGSNSRSVLKKQAKSRLIPAGEYLPYVVASPLELMGQTTMLEQFKSQRELKKGDGKVETFYIGKDKQLGSSICASIISPDDYRDFANQGATVFTNSAMLGIFDSGIFTLQHEGLARFMATANARPFLQSSTDGKAFAIDHNGRMLKNVSPSQTATVHVQANKSSTPYTLFGEWVVGAGFAFMIWGIFMHVSKALNTKKKSGPQKSTF